MPRSEIAGSYCVSICYFLRSLNTVFCAGCLRLLSHWECMRVPFSPYPCKHFLVTVFLMVAILTGGTGHLTVTLMCISLKVGDVECLLAICVSSSLERWLFQSFACFVFFVLLLRSMSISINHWERLYFIILSLRKGLSLCYWIWISILFSQKLKNTKGSCVWLRENVLKDFRTGFTFPLSKPKSWQS